MKRSYDLLNDPLLNKGTAFTQEERKKYGLEGLLPPLVQTIEEQATQAYLNYSEKTSPIEKRHYLMKIYSVNRTLFYYLFSKHLVEFMPVVYDPTVAEAVERYSQFYLDTTGAIFISIDQEEDMRDILLNATKDKEVELIVVTDAGQILGIGDWGSNGVEIVIGKLAVYTAAAGIDPHKVLPIVLDAGTNRQSLLDDPLYLGAHHERVKGEAYDAFIDSFVETVEELFPDMYLHFEDFGRDNAARILDKYKDRYAVFNDDIEGTGIVVLSAIIGALNISKEKLIDQRYLCFGAGTAGCGIVKRIYQEMLDEGLSEEEAKKRFYLFDKQGLLFEDSEGLTPEQRPFVRKREEFKESAKLTDLHEAVKAIRPTILVGTSTCPKAFDEEVVKEMCKHTERPIIFPLSNPTRLAEASAKDLIFWSKGKALVATGIPSDPVEYEGVSYKIGQANNALVYPGLGLGVISSKAALLTDKMISRAAHSLGGIVDISQKGAPVLPPIDRITDFSEKLAMAVVEEAVKEGLNKARIDDVEKCVKEHKWYPHY